MAVMKWDPLFTRTIGAQEEVKALGMNLGVDRRRVGSGMLDLILRSLVMWIRRMRRVGDIQDATYNVGSFFFFRMGVFLYTRVFWGVASERLLFFRVFHIVMKVLRVLFVYLMVSFAYVS
jgi:hypothetical protein